jgi:hypothetical protein
MTSEKSANTHHDDINDGRIVSSRHLVSDLLRGAVGAGICANYDQQRIQQMDGALHDRSG